MDAFITMDTLMSQILFNLQYAFRNLWRNRRWSTFGIFSVAAGVATVVALRSLGLAIGDSLTGNVRSSNHGDIALEISGNGGGPFNFNNPTEMQGFAEADVERAAAWADENGAQLSASTSSSNIQIAAAGFSTMGRPQFITAYFINPQTYPPTDDIRAVEPAGARLAELFQGGNEVVISDNMAANQSIKLGDTVRVSGTDEEFIVRGIIPSSAEAGLRNPFAAFFGFAYFDLALREKLPVVTDYTRLSIALPDPSPERIQAVTRTLQSLITASPYYRVQTVTDLLEDNQYIADMLSSFIVVLGLGALLIGGVGIMNTMLVMMRRRTDEIAALKTFGLKGRQVAALFMAEALLLGAAGSLLGGLFGTLLSGLANAYGQALIQQPLVWRLYPESLLFGLVLGVVVTAVFGIIPVLIAVKVRPALILRPNEMYIPRLGCLQSLMMIVVVIITIGLIAGQILQPAFSILEGRGPNNFVVGIIGVAVTLLILGILIGLLWLVVWLVGKLPSFGFIDLRLALRNLTTNRTRTATTLLALGAGMFALSSIAFFGAGLRQIIQFTLSEQLGGNVLIFPVLPAAIANPIIDGRLDSLEGVLYRTRYNNASGQLLQIDGVNVPETSDFDTNGGFFEDDDGGFVAPPSNWVQISAAETTNPNLHPGDLVSGRYLTPDDEGQPIAVLQLRPDLQALGLRVGSTINVEINGRVRDFEVVGLTAYQDANSGFSFGGAIGGDMQIPAGIIGDSMGFSINVAQVDAEQLNNVLVELSEIPLVYAFDITFIDNILSRFINQMSAIPILVGLLSLGAAAVIMANTVALSTLERRRQIGVLKAVGLKGRRILSVMLLENTLVSLLGSLLGIGLSSLGIAIMSSFGLSVTQLVPPDATPVAVVLLITAVAIAWMATFLSARSALGERVTSVLRYE